MPSDELRGRSKFVNHFLSPRQRDPVNRGHVRKRVAIQCETSVILALDRSRQATSAHHVTRLPMSNDKGGCSATMLTARSTNPLHRSQSCAELPVFQAQAKRSEQFSPDARFNVASVLDAPAGRARITNHAACLQHAPTYSTHLLVERAARIAQHAFNMPDMLDATTAGRARSTNHAACLQHARMLDATTAGRARSGRAEGPSNSVESRDWFA
jgi:hypothetical protein